MKLILCMTFDLFWFAKHLMGHVIGRYIIITIMSLLIKA